ncbi:MAG: hypothetical protein MMC23_001537 [Stictis urceolatum]|nr:hypothetical protein [Stictis urceolata]
MGLIATLISTLAPLFLILSPITSYADQIISMHRTRSSAGFSLDIPLIMLSASLLKVFYWPGARFDASLLVQALVMLVVQVVLLKVALDNRPGWRGAEAALPFADQGMGGGWRMGFWRWRGQRLYWQFLLLFTTTLLTLQILLSPNPDKGKAYTTLLGTLGLGIEATLPLPQLYSNYNSQSCKGFRLSVLANWLLGDAMKMGFFFMNDADAVPWAFKLSDLSAHDRTLRKRLVQTNIVDELLNLDDATTMPSQSISHGTRRLGLRASSQIKSNINPRYKSHNYTTSPTSARPISQPAHAGIPRLHATQPPSTTRNTSTSSPSKPSPTSPPPLRHRRVVSSFLTIGTPHTPSFHLALFLRSPHVKSYPSLWAACSGSIEASDPSPQAAALREIQEETGLGSEELELLAEGERVELVDEGLGTKWEIWPFVWAWREGREGGRKVGERLRGRIRLDGEHVDVRFVRPGEVRGMDTVEGLAGTVERALARVGGCHG